MRRNGVRIALMLFLSWLCHGCSHSSEPSGIVGPDSAQLSSSNRRFYASQFNLPPDVNQHWFDEDLALIWKLKRALPPPLASRAWLTELVGVRAQERVSLGFGLERSEARMGGGYCSCELRLVDFEGQLVELRIRCWLAEWQHLGSAARTAFGPAFRMDIDGSRGTASLDYRMPSTEQQSRRVLDRELGPLVAASVPAALAAAYERLMSPLSDLALGDSCSDGGPAEGRLEALSLARAGRYDLLRNVLRGPNPEARHYASWLMRRANRLSAADRAVADSLRTSSLQVETCAGCMFSRMPSDKADAHLDEGAPP